MKQEIHQKLTIKDFAVQGLDCADCAKLLEKAVGKIPGILEVRADLIKWMFIFWAGNVVTTAGLVLGAVSLLRR